MSLYTCSSVVCDVTQQRRTRERSRAVVDVCVPLESGWTLHYIALSPLATLDELVAVVVREVELTGGGVLGCAGVARDNKWYGVVSNQQFDAISVNGSCTGTYRYM